MFARSVSLSLKPNTSKEFSRTIEKEIIPLLRKQRGFQDEIMLIAAGGSEAVGISLWEERENADAYDDRIYPEIMRALAKFVNGTPRLATYEVSNSTFHKINFPVSV